MTHREVPQDGPPAAPATPSWWGRLKRRGWHWSDVIWIAALLYAAPTLLPHVGAVLGVRTTTDLTPGYSYVSLTGEPLTSEALRGKVVLVNFWATWCTPCKVEMPLLQAMAERHAAAGLVVLGLSRDLDPPAKVQAFLTERDITYPNAVVGADAERTFGGVRGYPTSFLLDRQGRIRHQAMGPLAMASFEPAVRRLLAETAP